MILFFYSLAVVAVLFAVYWSQRAWGLGAALVVAFIGGIFIRFVPLPFGTLLAASASIPVIYAARANVHVKASPPSGRVVKGTVVEPDEKDEHGG